MDELTALQNDLTRLETELHELKQLMERLAWLEELHLSLYHTEKAEHEAHSY